jgi:hypothetical protein
MTQPPMTKESQALASSLADQRDHVLGILEGLSEEDLQRPILPRAGPAPGWYTIWRSTSSGFGSVPSSPASRCQTTSLITPGRSLRT